jgi:hypothetical protein
MPETAVPCCLGHHPAVFSLACGGAEPGLIVDHFGRDHSSIWHPERGRSADRGSAPPPLAMCRALASMVVWTGAGGLVILGPIAMPDRL